MTVIVKFGQGSSMTRREPSSQRMNPAAAGLLRLGSPLDEDDQPHGFCTITYSSSDRFEGHFVHGEKNGRGKFYFFDGSILEGYYVDDALQAQGVYTYEDGGVLHGTYLEGELNGPAREYDAEGRLIFKGQYKDNTRHGMCWLYYPPAEGAVPRGLLISNDNTAPRENTRSGPVYTFDKSTSACISTNCLLPDPYESERVYVADSLIAGAGEGLFAKTEAESNTVMAFYNGVRITHETVDSRDWSLNRNTISLDEDTVLDVPEPYNNVKRYSASLGHKANHSFTPNCIYDPFVHPRFGPIKCIRTLRAVESDEELMVAYGYDHSPLGKSGPEIKCIRTLRAVESDEELMVAYGYDHSPLGKSGPEVPEWYKQELQAFKG
ncbi:UNVERIFIED_CONTAM: hypothetical protein FKN15_027876 [Acipenser sinensis]